LITELFSAPAPLTSAGAGTPAPLAPWLESTASWLAVPLRTRDAAIGVLVLGSHRPDAYQPAQLEVAAALVAQGIAAHSHASLFVQVQRRALIDELTGIANRRHFFHLAEPALATAREQRNPVIAVMLDIDHFKRINDGYGHPTGDDVIRVVAARLSGHRRATDLLARYGGEEFVLLLPRTDQATGLELADRLRMAVEASPVETRSCNLPVTISVGVASSRPDDTIDGLLARADQALYLAKGAGRNQVRAV
jgi:diguanylate cyclase (GGDEF)-like protein